MQGITRTKPLGNPVPAGCRGGKQAGFRDRLRGIFLGGLAGNAYGSGAFLGKFRGGRGKGMTGGNRGENQGQEDDAGDGDDEHIPAMGAQDGSGRRTDKAGAYVIEEPVEAGRAAFGPVCPDGDEAARHGIGSRKSEADRFPSGFGMVHSQVLHAVHGLSMLPKEWLPFSTCFR